MTYIEALQASLAAEHAAIYLYGALGGQTSESGSPSLYAAITEAYDAHRTRRDIITARVVDERKDPVAALATYELPADLSTDALINKRALQLERSCAATYAYLVANSPAADRPFAITALNETAVRELTFQGTPEMFPGSSEYADR